MNYNIKNKTAECFMYGEISSYDSEETITAKMVQEFLQEATNQNVTSIDVHINSVGGSVFEGVAIYNLLNGFDGTINVYVDGLAASIASIIAMSGNTITMLDGSFLMIHNPMTFTGGNAEELKKQVELLETMRDTLVDIYAKRTGKPTEDIKALMDVETWLTADQAIEYGFADNITQGLEVAAVANTEFLNNYKHSPKTLLNRVEKQTATINKELVEQANDIINKIKEMNNLCQ